MIFLKQIFSNADRVHVNKVLSKLGLSDCFDEIVCFETLNPPITSNDQDQSGLIDTSSSGAVDKSSLYKHVSGSAVVALPQSPIVCKPFEEAFAQAFKAANINPQTTVSLICVQHSVFLILFSYPV